MAEMPAAMPLTSRTERRTALFHGAGDVFDLFDGDLHGVIDLLQTGMGTVARVAEKVAMRSTSSAVHAAGQYRLAARVHWFYRGRRIL